MKPATAPSPLPPVDGVPGGTRPGADRITERMGAERPYRIRFSTMNRSSAMGDAMNRWRPVAGDLTCVPVGTMSHVLTPQRRPVFACTSFWRVVCSGERQRMAGTISASWSVAALDPRMLRLDRGDRLADDRLLRRRAARQDRPPCRRPRSGRDDVEWPDDAAPVGDCVIGTTARFRDQKIAKNMRFDRALHATLMAGNG